MKKIITISVIFALLLGAGIWEMTYSSKLYKEIYAGLIKVEESMEANDEKINNPDTLELMDEVTKHWEKGREIVFCLGNHAVLRNIDEKIISLDAMIKINHKDDAKVTVEVAKSLIKAVMNDTHPIPSNLF